MIPKTITAFKKPLFSLLDLKTKYWNEYPYNLGYYHSDGAFSFDCVNLVKAVLNGWEDKKQVGYFVRDLSVTGDCNEYGLIMQCQNVSGDFSKLKETSVLYMDGHIGVFVGLFTRGNKFYNVIECTSNQWGDGVICSYIDETGRRLKYKGSSDSCGRWTKHGTMQKWLTYDESAKPFDHALALRLAVKMERGDFGNNPQRKETVTKKYGADYYTAAQDIINYLYGKY